MIASNQPGVSLKLKNFLYESRIPFNEVQNKKSTKDLGVKSHPLAYDKRHMPYKDILKMLIKWRDIEDKEYENKVKMMR